MVTSRYDVEHFDDHFSYQGTDDNSQYYTAKTALKFYQDIGGYVSYCPIAFYYFTLAYVFFHCNVYACTGC